MFRRRLARERELAKGRERIVSENVRLNVAVALSLAALVGWANGVGPGAAAVLVVIPAGVWAGRVRGRRQWEWLNSWDD